MIRSVPRPLLFLDVDGPLIPFGATREQYPEGYPTYSPQEAGANPLLARVNPALGPRLLALPCDLVWATTWESEANECLGQAVHDRRTELGISQTEPAKRADMTQPQVSKLELGGTVPTLPLLARLAEALDASLDIALDGGTSTVAFTAHAA